MDETGLIREEEVVTVVSRPNTRSTVDMAKLPKFSRKVGKVSEFLIACRLYIRMRMRNAVIGK